MVRVSPRRIPAKVPASMAQSGSKRRTSTGGASISPPPLKRKQSTTTRDVVANFFTPLSKKEPERTTWRVVDDSLLIARHEIAEINRKSALGKCCRIAGFDLDYTIIKTASGTKFGKDASDWKWWNNVVPPTLRNLHAEGYLLIVFTNQGAVNLNGGPKTAKRDQKSLANFKGKLTALLNQLDLPISVYAATRRDKYRKPRSGMWEEMLEDHDLNNELLDLEGSFFVGDAAGRPASDGSNRDFSCSDRDFAANIGIKFHTPEEFFLKEAPKPFTRDFDPTAYLDKNRLTSAATSKATLFSKENMIDIVLFCGSPASGKSTFYWKHVKPLGYERVNQDILKTRDKCTQIASRYLSEGKPVVIDNTNASPETRAVWVQLAGKHSVPIRCFYFTAPTQLCLHNDTVRALGCDTLEDRCGGDNIVGLDYSFRVKYTDILAWVQQLNPEKRASLPLLAFTSFSSRFREPTLEEGYTDITKVDFHFEGSDEERAIWSKYWI